MNTIVDNIMDFFQNLDLKKALLGLLIIFLVAYGLGFISSPLDPVDMLVDNIFPDQDQYQMTPEEEQYSPINRIGLEMYDMAPTVRDQAAYAHASL